MTTTFACPRCGTEIVAGNKYCSECGADMTGPAGLAATTRLTSIQSQQTLVELLQQATIGEFEILKELGRGGMAMVFLAHDISLNRKVALKVMSPTLGGDELMAERFVREAQTAAALSHPNIIPVYAVKHHELVTFFVMKFIPGRPLDDIMSELGPMPFEMVAAILQQVGGALGYGHRRGVVHRDVKPGNVMIDEEGWAIVTDFGIAKVDQAEGLTRTGAAIGTPTYMSPEQCTAKEVTGASDQYSLGVVAYEMLTGRKPFEGASVLAIMYGHVHEQLPDLLTLRPECPRQLYEAVSRMLTKDPAARFPTMDDLVSAIEAAPLTHDHSVRTQMMTLAAEGLSAKLMKQVVTPRSPIPRARTAPPVTPSPGLTRQQTAAATAGQHAEPTPLPRPGTMVGTPRKQESRKGLVYAGGGILAVSVAAAVFFLGPWSQSNGEPVGDPPPVVTGDATPATTLPAAPTVARIQISPDAGTLDVGQTLRLDATALDGNGSPVASAQIDWSSGNDGIATVSESGDVTAVDPGTVDVIATSGSVRSTVSLIVEEPPPPTPPTIRVTSVSVNPTALSLVEGESEIVRATARGSNGSTVSGRPPIWRSSNETVAQVSSSGQVRAVAPGSATISVTIDNQRADVSVSVGPEPVASVSVRPASETLDSGETVELSANLLAGSGGVLTGRSVSWATSDPSIATVSSRGVVTGMSPGQVTIEATAEGRRGTASITVDRVAVQPTVPSEADTRAQIRSLIEAWGDALESRNVSNLLQANPSMTRTEQQSWSDFLSELRSITVGLDITSISIDGNVATATVSAQYDYSLRSGGPQTQQPQLVARFALEGMQWRMTSIR